MFNDQHILFNSVSMAESMGKKPKLMGILNITPDSFYEKSRAYSTLSAIKRGILLEAEGADIIDIGGFSSRPGAEIVSEEEEIKRVIPVILALKQEVKIPLSIDTMNPKVAAMALDSGCSYINDISGFSDSAMISTAKQTQANLILMHMQGIPKTMQINPHYPEGIIPHLINFFQKRIETLLKAGILENRIIIDPGVGFGKLPEHNIQILKSIDTFKSLGFPVLIGLSRKSFISKLIGKPCEELLFATIALNAAMITRKVDIIRVHDVKEHRDVIDILHTHVGSLCG